MWRRFVKLRFSKKLLLFMFISNTIFTVCVLYIAFAVQYEPQVLVGSWFAFMSVEAWSSALVRKEKLKKEGQCNGNE